MVWLWIPLQGSHGAARLDPLSLVLDASLVVQLVMGLLILMSLVSWTIVGSKFIRISSATGGSRRFIELFWSEGHDWTVERLEGLYAQVNSFKSAPVAEVFRAGYVELARLSSTELQDYALENVERALARAKNNELTRIEAALTFLATTGSTAPFIGLFGTVWGIMNSFLSIGAEKSASLDVVAPGIAEALIATAIGLVAAIPAVAAYNFFLRKIRVLEGEIDAFSSDYLNIVRRHFLEG